MFKKEIIEKDGEQMFKINGMYFKYDNDKVDDTDPEIQNAILEFSEFYNSHPFSIWKDAKTGKCEVSLTRVDDSHTTCNVIYHDGFQFIYDMKDVTPFLDFTQDLLNDWIARFRDWVVALGVVYDDGEVCLDVYNEP